MPVNVDSTSSSFMIVDQPNFNANPVVNYEKTGLGLYTANVSVTLVSLLYDFMEIYPTLIQLTDIGR
jgi:hypothetical protein